MYSNGHFTRVNSEIINGTSGKNGTNGHAQPPQDDDPFVMVRYSFLKHLDPQEAVLLAYLIGMERRFGGGAGEWFYRSREDIEADLNIAPRRQQRSLALLKDRPRPLIESSYDGHRRRFRIVWENVTVLATEPRPDRPAPAKKAAKGTTKPSTTRQNRPVDETESSRESRARDKTDETESSRACDENVSSTGQNRPVDETESSLPLIEGIRAKDKEAQCPADAGRREPPPLKNPTHEECDEWGWPLSTECAPSARAAIPADISTPSQEVVSNSKKPAHSGSLNNNTPSQEVVSQDKKPEAAGSLDVEWMGSSSEDEADRAAVKLHTLLSGKGMITRKPSMRQWAQVLRKLRGEVGAARFDAALDWYCLNAGGEYVPHAAAANTFAEKFDRIEAAMKRAAPAGAAKQFSPADLPDEARYAYDQFKNEAWPSWARPQLATVLGRSWEACREWVTAAFRFKRAHAWGTDEKDLAVAIVGGFGYEPRHFLSNWVETRFLKRTRSIESARDLRPLVPGDKEFRYYIQDCLCYAGDKGFTFAQADAAVRAFMGRDA